VAIARRFTDSGLQLLPTSFSRSMNSLQLRGAASVVENGDLELSGCASADCRLLQQQHSYSAAPSRACSHEKHKGINGAGGVRPLLWIQVQQLRP
jgi:hypothetical protein